MLQTGLHGFVRKSPITPVCDAEACDGSAAGVMLIFTREDGVMVRVVTRSTGFYRAVLAPGRYAVTAHVQARQDFSEKTARVVEGRDGRLDFHIDTGIQ